jgi:RNA polymerase sigma factor (sigma-70 family)
MFEVFNTSYNLLQAMLGLVTLFAGVMLAVPTLNKAPQLLEAFARIWRRRGRNPIPVVDLSQTAPAPGLHGPVGRFARATRVLLANIGGFAEDAKSWPTDDLDRKTTGLFSSGPDLDRVTYVTREVWEWVRDFERLPEHARDELASIGITAQAIRHDLVSEEDFFDRFHRVVSTLQAFDLRMQQTGSHPFRGLAGPSVHLSLDDAREHERHEAARQADYEQVMNAHGRSIANIARRYAKDPAEREDLEQEIALAIWRALPRFRGESSVRTYVLRIAHNTGCGFRKKRRLAPSAAEVVDTSGCPELGAQRRERSRRLTGAMAELPAKLRDVISLRLRGHSYAEISDELSITETNVSVRLTRARRFLRDRLLATG